MASDEIDEAGVEGGGGDDAAASDARLQALIGGSASREERETWASMPPARRAKAVQRMKALDRYVLAKGAIPARTAAIDAGVELGRFYQMARAWKAKRSLASLGAYAEAPKARARFDATVVNDLQRAVVAVVRDHPGESVAEQTRLLAAACSADGRELPRRNTLRVFVERERARVREAGLAGTELLFDCSLSSIAAEADAFVTVFLVLDKATGLILGHAAGDAADSVSGYGAAAEDALARLAGPLGRAAIWSTAMERSQLVPGEDVERVRALLGRLRARIGGASPQMLGPGRYGTYARDRLGSKIGPVRLHPSRTAKRKVPSREALESARAYTRERLELWVSAHDEETLAATGATGSKTPPPGMVALLTALARGG